MRKKNIFLFFYMCVIHLGMCVFKCVCVCRPDIDVGSLPDHCLLYLLRQGLPLNAESLDSASLAKLDCLASVSHKQGLQGGFLFSFQGSRCSPHTCSKYLLSHSLFLVPQAELSALFKRLKGWYYSSQVRREGQEEEGAGRGKDGERVWMRAPPLQKPEDLSSDLQKLGTAAQVSNSSTLTVRWDIETEEFPKVSRPSSLVYVTGKSHPRFSSDFHHIYAHRGMCSSPTNLHTYTCTYTDKRMIYSNQRVPALQFSYYIKSSL